MLKWQKVVSDIEKMHEFQYNITIITLKNQKTLRICDKIQTTLLHDEVDINIKPYNDILYY